jgi:hypothetical protein
MEGDPKDWVGDGSDMLPETDSDSDTVIDPDGSVPDTDVVFVRNPKVGCASITKRSSATQLMTGQGTARLVFMDVGTLSAKPIYNNAMLMQIEIRIVLKANESQKSLLIEHTHIICQSGQVFRSVSRIHSAASTSARLSKKASCVRKSC